MVGHLSLSRDHHSSDLVASLRDILEENSLVDCMISSEGQYLKVHKLILSACSPYFQALFREETDKYPIVLLKDVEFEYLKLIINFIYCGEVQVLDTQLNSFLEVAKFLQIKGLNASSRECSPERMFSEHPGSTSIQGNESDEIRATNEIVVHDDDDDCQVIDLPGASASEVHEQPCADSAERSLMITDESTFSLALQGNKVPASQDFIRAADQEWHSRPVSPVSVTSITSVKTEQLVDGEEISGHSRTCSENENLNEHMECVDSEDVIQANDTRKLDNCPSVNADSVKEVENTSIVQRSISAGEIVLK
ncbi:hypothetical protein R5R35_010000 [Gryllus longicercus]|uniref:BTB domain-containing protein n=1 Tax=Gryllus longicercus TaxID=2509291 RepID=A0AAN9VQQ8_9ORTH